MNKFFRFERKIGWSEILAILAVIISGIALLLSYLAWQDFFCPVFFPSKGDHAFSQSK